MYNALGIAAPQLYDVFNFDSFLGSLHAELCSPEMATILKRRIIVLISQWVSVRCSEPQRALVYDIILGQMQQSEEPRMALVAACAVEKIVDDWDWKSETFEPFANPYVVALVDCLDLCYDAENKMKMLSAIGMICDRVGPVISPSLDVVLKQIPMEWNNCDEQHLLQVALLTLLSRLTSGLKEESNKCYPIAVPLIQHSADPEQVGHIYLVEEAFELWHSIVQNAKEPSADLAQLVPILVRPDMLANATDTLQKVLLIIESNILLFQDALLAQGPAQSLVHTMVTQLPQLSKDALSHFTRVLSLGTIVWQTQCYTDVDLYLISEMLLQPNEEPVITTCILCLICQIVLADVSRLTRLWQQFPQGDATTSMVRTMFDKFDGIGHPKHRKLCAMALTALVKESPHLFRDATTVACLGNVWSDVLAEVQANTGADTVYWADEGDLLLEDQLGDHHESAEGARRKAVSQRDPVCQTPLKSYIRSHLPLVNTELLGVNLEPFLSS